MQRSSEWLAKGSIGDVRAELIDAARRRGGRVNDLGSEDLELSFGSRLSYRLGGILIKASRERLPMKARIGLTPVDDTVRVEATVCEDPGWNAASLW
ncbi:MAG: hypothetical protein ACR2LV_01925 [Solirubrobacteraceae bacterium]